MWDEIVDGLLEAIRLGAMEQCRERRERAFQELLRKRTQTSRERISEITRQIKEIDRIVQKVMFKSRLMQLTEVQQKLITDEVIGKFADMREQLVKEKLELAR